MKKRVLKFSSKSTFLQDRNLQIQLLQMQPTNIQLPQMSPFTVLIGY